jgi:hypothetical protein
MKYRPTLGISQPSDQNRAAEIDADNCRQRTSSSSSSRDRPRGVLSPTTTRCCSVPAQSSHELERGGAQKKLPPGSPTQKESVSGSWQPEESDGHGDLRLIVGLPARARQSGPAGGASSDRAAALVDKDDRRPRRASSSCWFWAGISGAHQAPGASARQRHNLVGRTVMNEAMSSSVL